MVRASIPQRFGQYKQESRRCHSSSVAATGLYAVLTSRFWISAISALDLFLCHMEAIFQRPRGKVSLFLIDQERRRQANGVLTCTEHQQPFVKCQIDDQIAQIGAFFLGPLIPDDFDANHQSASTYIANDLEVFRPVCEAREKVVAHATSVFLVLTFDQVHGCQCCRKAHRVSTKGGAVGARPPAHHALLCNDRAERHAAGNTLRGTKNVRFDSGVVTGPPLPGAPHARLHFVHDEHDAVLAADTLQFLEEELRRGYVPPFALDGLDDDTCNVFGIEQTLENLPFKLLENFRAASLCGVAARAAISIRIRNVFDAAEQCAESFALR